MNEVKISKNQAVSFAATIINDIKEYIDNHQEDFQEFLKEEASAEENCRKSA